MRARSALPLVALLIFGCAAGPPDSPGPSPQTSPGATRQQTPSLGRSVFLLTFSAPSTTCLDGEMTGVLATDSRSGVGVMADDDGTLTPVRWPFGWRAVNVDDRVMLIDPAGSVVGGEGDSVTIRGGTKRAFWEACPEVSVTPKT